MRAFDTAMQEAVQAGVIVPVLMLQITFVSGTYYAWTGIGPLVWNGNTFLGVGTMGEFDGVIEGISVHADGTRISLSGIDPALYGDSIADIQVGADARTWLGFLADGALVGAPYLNFAGMVDQPESKPGPEEITISINLENRMTNLQRAGCARYTAADQHIAYPDDTGFNGVERLSDQALLWQ